MNPEDIIISTFPAPTSGGMHTGAINSGITALHIPTQIGVIVNSERSQYRNKERALELLSKLMDKPKYDYSCKKGEDGCVCGGDTQGVRQGCGNYTGEQL